MHQGIAYPPYLVENGGHNNLELIARQPFYDNFTKFLQWSGSYIRCAPFSIRRPQLESG